MVRPADSEGHEDPYQVIATGVRPDDHTRVLKRDDTFALLDQQGSISTAGLGEQGLYHQGTRFLSRYVLRINDQPPAPLSSNVINSDVMLAVDLTNPDLVAGGGVTLPRGTVHIFRSSFLWQASAYERLRLHNYGSQKAQLGISYLFDADFADIFEVRGTRRARRGVRRAPHVRGDSVRLSYRGLDGVERGTVLRFHGAEKVGPGHATFLVDLEPGAQTELFVTITCTLGVERPRLAPHGHALNQAIALVRSHKENECRIRTSNATFNQWLDRSGDDIRMMTTQTATGPYPYAGVPWYSAPFGRDGIITAWQMCWVAPTMARGVLRFLARHQATHSEAERDAEPGKILHEMRQGEMASLGEIPFGRYYGTVDATPLFVMLAGEYLDATADLPLIRELWPNIVAALDWMSESGDQDGDGFLEYGRRASGGLANQGWKDSHDSIFHADGGHPEGPIALCEVQSYAYAAWLAASRLARALGKSRMAARCQQTAERLQTTFEKKFWCEDLGTYALALDGKKHACKVRSSNAGHCLFSGLASPERAARVAEQLLSPAFSSGWGIRTLGEHEARYNPMSYHNGSVWPHDNAIIALGFSRYGFTAHAAAILEAIFSAGILFDEHRLPELYCGFRRRDGEAPTSYPVACIPQAWASGSVFMLLRACLGMKLDATHRRLTFQNPTLPVFLDELHLSNLRIGDAGLDIVMRRHGLDVGMEIHKRKSDLDVCILK